jgi:hypothetical protein
VIVAIVSANGATLGGEGAEWGVRMIVEKIENMTQNLIVPSDLSTFHDQCRL